MEYMPCQQACPTSNLRDFGETLKSFDFSNTLWSAVNVVIFFQREFSVIFLIWGGTIISYINLLAFVGEAFKICIFTDIYITIFLINSVLSIFS